MRCFWLVCTENRTNLSSQVSPNFCVGPRLTRDQAFFEIARLLLRLDQVANLIVNVDHGIA